MGARAEVQDVSGGVDACPGTVQVVDRVAGFKYHSKSGWVERGGLTM